MTYRLRQIKAIEAQRKKDLLRLNINLTERSGVYILIREDENGIKYAYVGQAKHILTRLAQHFAGYQHIDLSLKKHGLCSNDNVYGWRVHAIECEENKLDELEQKYILQYARAGYQLRNKTAGGQGKGKVQIDEYKPSRTYRDGLKQGYKNASKEIANLFEKHLNYSRKSDKPNKNQDKAIDKLEAFLQAHKGE